MIKKYDRVKVIDGVLCSHGNPVDLVELADRMNNIDKTLDEVAANKIKWAAEDKIRDKKRKKSHDEFMQRMEVKKAKAREKHEERVKKHEELDLEAQELLEAMRVDVVNIVDRCNGVINDN